MKKILAFAVALVFMFTVYAVAEIPHPVGSISGGVPSNGAPGGDYLGSTATRSIASGDSYTIPIGTWFIIPDSNGTIQINRGTSSSPTWVNYQSAGVAGFTFSDGVGLRVSASGATSTTYTIKMI